MELYLSIFKLFLDKDIYNKYKDCIDKEFLRDNYPELLKILNTIERLRVEKATIVDLEACFRANYPQADSPTFPALFTRIEGTKADNEEILNYLSSVNARQKAANLAFVALDFSEGKKSQEDFTNALESLRQESEIVDPESDEEFVSDDIELLYEKAVKEGGLNWRLESLNRSLGPLRKGDFGFIFARPETGKTTFLASEVSHFAGQVEKPILWINNEEQGEKVGIRCYEAALGATLEQVLSDKARAKRAFLSRTKGNIRIKDDTGISRVGIERLCGIHEPSLIVIDQLDKVKGFDADREDLRMGAIYQWARELAKRFAPVIGVCQADGSGEGIKWLNMGNVSNAKTAKQAEADWILGIGVSYQDPPNVRGFSICKNKLLGGELSIPSMRHSHWEVLLEPDIGRYRDTA